MFAATVRKEDSMTNAGLAAKAGRNLAALAIFFAVLAVAARGGAAIGSPPVHETLELAASLIGVAGPDRRLDHLSAMSSWISDLRATTEERSSDPALTPHASAAGGHRSCSVFR
jgi:hypothetical protein